MHQIRNASTSVCLSVRQSAEVSSTPLIWTTFYETSYQRQTKSHSYCGTSQDRYLNQFYFNWAPRHEGEMGVGVGWSYSSMHSLTSALHWGELSASRSGRFTPTERDPGTYWIGGWVDSRTGPDVVLKKRIPSPCRE
jgi:hypothetical protein